MPSNNFDDPILIDNGVGTPGSPGGYFGFGRAANAVISTGPRMYAGTGTPAGVLTAPIGSLYLQSDGAGSTYVNTNGGTAWAFSTVVAAAGLISDPGTGNAIPVTATATVAITTGGSGQTNTLAIPTFIGQELAIIMDVDGGGNRVITVASAFNIAGNTVITLADAGDFVKLQAAQIGGALRWRLVVNDGAALS